jgi:NAD(P)-dependent dehydrogenase (short-subunit alcohol dehydrogenase family)
MSRPALAHMLERGWGRIINISSVVAETGNVGQANLRRVEVRSPRPHQVAGA